MRVIDLFCGIGGFRLGLEKVGQLQQGMEQPKRSRSIESNRGKSKFNCVWANDNDRYACQIYRKHWGDGELYEGDIFKIQARTIPNHDLLCAGFPCQSFSIAGKRGGFQDTRGTLFYEICRIAEAKRTPYLFLENVKGLLNHEGGETFWEILSMLDELGYDCQWQVLNSKDFGVPQNRERVFIIGYLRGQPRPKVFPIRETSEGIDERANETPNIRTLQGGGHSGGHHSGMTLLHTAYPDGAREYEDISPTISTPAGGGHLPYVANTVDVDGYLRFGARPRDEEGKPQLLPIGYRRIRRLTPLECERLQGFPDGWTEGISDTQRYKCLGNAVTVNVIEAIGKVWIKYES